MRRDVTELSEEQIIEIAIAECERIGYQFLNIKKLKHPDDFYLRYVIGFNESKEEYATWMMNVEMGGLHYGHYFLFNQRTKEETYEVALRDFQER